MSLPTYADISRQLAIPRCRGVLPNGQTCHLNHEGSIDIDFRNVHWADRRATRGGIRFFLHLASMRRLGHVQPYWARYYLAQTQVNMYADEIGVRFPKDVSDFYRAQLKAMLVDVPASEPGRTEAMRWATR